MFNIKGCKHINPITLYFATSSLTSFKSPLVKINPTFPCSIKTCTFSSHTNTIITANTDKQKRPRKQKKNKKWNDKRNKSETYNKERDEVENGLVSSVLSMNSDTSLHHGILTHENHRITAQTSPDVLKLVRPHVVGYRHQNLRILIEQLAKLVIISDLLVGLGSLRRHWWNNRSMTS